MPLAQSIETETMEDGATPQGALFVSIKNEGTETATVNGVPLEPGAAKSYSFVGKGYEAIPYQANGSTLRIMYIE